MPGKVAVIIPNYNHAPYLSARIDSVLGQDYGNYEVLILDDASTDESLSIIGKYKQHEKVKICINENNSGSVFSQWQKGISLSESDYIWIAESDDCADPRFLSTLVEILESNPRVVLAYCQSHYVDAEGKIFGNAKVWTDDLDEDRWGSDFLNTGCEENKYYLSVKNTILNASAVVFERSAYEKINANTGMKLCGDWLIWSRILRHGDVAFCAKSLNYFRTHGDNVRFKTKNAEIMLEILDVMKEIIAHSELSRKDRVVVGDRIEKYWRKLLAKQSFGVVVRYCCFLVKIRKDSPVTLLSVLVFRRTQILFERVRRRLSAFGCANR